MRYAVDFSTVDTKEKYTSGMLSQMVIEILSKAGDDFSGTWVMRSSALKKALEGAYVPSMKEEVELDSAFVLAEAHLCMAANRGHEPMRCKAAQAVMECFNEALSYLFLEREDVAIAALSAMADLDEKYHGKEPSPCDMIKEMDNVKALMERLYLRH